MNTSTARFDEARHTGQLRDVYRTMRDGKWRTLWELRIDVATKFGTHYPEQSISARVRDLRKPKFGGYEVLRRPASECHNDGLFEYRLNTKKPKA